MAIVAGRYLEIPLDAFKILASITSKITAKPIYHYQIV